jgi:hypothetical protein
MTESYSTTNVFKQCATCEYWGAAREVRNGYFRQTVEIEGDIYGQCRNGESLFNQQQQRAGSGCSRWVKWSAIG